MDDGAVRDLVSEAVSRAARLGTAGALRMQAVTLRSLAETQLAMARTLDDQAEAIEAGSEPVPSGGERLRIVREPVDEPDDEREEETPGVAQPVARAGAAFVGPEGEGLSPAMIEWLDQFDDRIAGHPAFVAAVNELAEEGRELTPDAARLVAARVRELAEQAGFSGEER